VSSFLLLRPPPSSPLFPYTTLFRSRRSSESLRRCCSGGRAIRAPPLCSTGRSLAILAAGDDRCAARGLAVRLEPRVPRDDRVRRSEEHTSELQSRFDLVCRLLLEKK